MTKPLTDTRPDLKPIRDWAQDIIDAAERETIERGIAGATRERARGTAAQELLALLDSLPAPRPALSVEEVRAAAMAALTEVIEWFAGPTYWHDNPSAHPRVLAIADRIAEKLAGRPIAGLSADEIAVARAWRDTMDPIRGEREHNARSALLDRLLALEPRS